MQNRHRMLTKWYNAYQIDRFYYVEASCLPGNLVRRWNELNKSWLLRLGLILYASAFSSHCNVLCRLRSFGAQSLRASSRICWTFCFTKTISMSQDQMLSKNDDFIIIQNNCKFPKIASRKRVLSHYSRLCI